MKRLLTATTILVLMMAGNCAFSQELKSAPNMAIGARLGSGFALVAGDGYEQASFLDRNDRSAKYSGAFDAYFNYYFTPVIGIEAGLGLVSKGIHLSGDNWDHKVRHLYMEIPLLAKFNLNNFHLGAGVALWIALSGKSTSESDNIETTIDWEGDDWDYLHRTNVGLKFLAGYAIPAGPIFIVPAVSWTIHLINDMNRGAIEDDFPGINTDDYKARYNNLLFHVGIEYAF